MKTSKIITSLVAMNLVVFMSVSSIANSFTGNTGDDSNRSVKNQTESDISSIVDKTSSNASENDFSHLRFNVNNFSTESGLEDLPMNSLNYLRFDSNNFSEVIASEITELPVMNQFDYLRFDSNDFGKTSEINELPLNELDYLQFDINSYNNATEISEMPVDEFDYLRFDLNKFSNETSSAIVELPVN